MPGPKARPPELRYWTFVERREANECWPWLGGLQGSGYGQFNRVKGRTLGAHRYAWELANGRPAPHHLHVMHSCDNRLCVNPAHLSLGTAGDNNRDKSVKGRNPGNRTKGRAYRRKIDDHLARELRAQGLMFHEIAALLGVSTTTAFRAVRRGET